MEKEIKIRKSWGDMDPKTKAFKDKRAYKRSKNKEVVKKELEDYADEGD